METSVDAEPERGMLACPAWMLSMLHTSPCGIFAIQHNNNLLDMVQATWQAGYLVENMRYACFTGRHLAVALGLGLPALLLLGLGIPLLFAFMVWRHRLELDSAPCRTRLGFAYRSYK